MIPRRIVLENFLSYGPDPAHGTITFDGEPLWVLTGPNGVGKSAIFDAITYALFGKHRGGHVHADELIHYGADGFRIEFEFEFAGDVYRIVRTRRRTGRPTQQAFRRPHSPLAPDGRGVGGEGGEADSDWPPVPGINLAKDLENWVERDLGLRYQTFTASVLLLQGQAERLISADPKERLQVLHGVIDFQRYVALHDKAKKASDRVSAQVDKTLAQLDKTPAVAPEESQAAQQAVDGAEEACLIAKDRFARLQRLAGQAEGWESLVRDQSGLEQLLAAAAERAAHAAEIEQQANRLRELETNLPTVRHVVQLRSQACNLDRHQQTLKAEIAAMSGQRAAWFDLLGQESDHLKQSHDCVVKLDADLKQVAAQLQQVAAQLQQADQRDRVHAALSNLRSELAEVPDNLAKQLTAAKEACEQARRAREFQPLIEALVRERTDHRVARGEEQAAAGSEQAAALEITKCQSQLQQLEATAQALEAERQTCENALSQADARQEDAAKTLKEFQTVEGKKKCSLCGQKVDAAHARAERNRLEAAIKHGKEEADELRAKLRTLKKKWTAARSKCREAEQFLGETGLKHTNAVHMKTASARRAEECAKRYDAARLKFPEDVKQHLPAVDDATDTSFPTPKDIAANKTSAGAIQERQALADHLQAQETKRTAIASAIASQESTLTVFAAIPPTAGLRGEHARLEAARKQATAEQDAATKAHAATLAAVKDVEARIAEQDGKLIQATTREGEMGKQLLEAKNQATAESARLPDPWRKSVQALDEPGVDKLAAELARLMAADVHGQDRALQQDRVLQADRAERVRKLAAAIAELPPEARRPSAQVEVEVENADQAVSAAETARERARHHREKLAQHTAQRKQYARQLQEEGRAQELHRKLEKLLGRDGLQRDLVRDAEAAIVELANETLTRLSYGEMRLEPDTSAEEPVTDKALDLCVSQASHSFRTGIAFLSGSQKFRVAVALALAIGQFASKQARPLESVILDEGFGCLDREGRQSMIQELQRLRDCLKRIVLVSHDDEISQAFPVGYKLITRNGATVVEPFRW